MAKKKKYAYGTVKQYIETPQEAMAENDIAMAKAKYEAETDPWANALSMFGNTAIQVGGSMMQKGIANGDGADGTGIDGFLAKNSGDFSSLMGLISGFNSQGGFAFGGSASGQIEAEGDEIIETADGTVSELKGPKHEQGGIDLNVPKGTTIFSDRIMVDGKSIADRKEAREKKLKQLEKKILKNGSDKILSDTLNRTKEGFDKEEAKDLHVQSIISFVAGTQGKAMFGLNDTPGLFDIYNILKGVEIPNFTGSTDDLHNPTYTTTGPNISGKTPGINPDAEEIDFNLDGGKANKSSRLTTDEDLVTENGVPQTNTFGNALGIFGNLVSAIGPYRNTLKNRAGDTPNINAFKGFGEDALNVNEEAQDYVQGQRDSATKAIERGTVASKNKNRNSARSVNTMRALDLSTDMAANQSKENIYNNSAKQMMELLGQKSSIELQQDQAVMTGEQNRDLADRQDRDNFYTQLSQDIANMGQGIQQTGKDLNQAKQQEVIAKILSQLNKYGVTFDENYNLQNPTN